jgi:hypothetical protein
MPGKGKRMGDDIIKINLRKTRCKDVNWIQNNSRWGTMGGFCEYGDKFSCSITSGNFLSPY